MAAQPFATKERYGCGVPLCGYCGCAPYGEGAFHIRRARPLGVPYELPTVLSVTSYYSAMLGFCCRAGTCPRRPRSGRRYRRTSLYAVGSSCTQDAEAGVPYGSYRGCLHRRAESSRPTGSIESACTGLPRAMNRPRNDKIGSACTRLCFTRLKCRADTCVRRAVQTNGFVRIW